MLVPSASIASSAFVFTSLTTSTLIIYKGLSGLVWVYFGVFEFSIILYGRRLWYSPPRECSLYIF